ncbi:MAG: beta-galactosidase [Victivallales bacterium]|nr:beta-galactosidase [Victivallales bacterium]
MRPAALVATYVMVYDDNTTETIFAQLRWNSGVYSSNFLSRGIADYTWWGPPGFTWASAEYIPIETGIRWNSVYVTKYINPHPEKSIKKIIAVQNTSTVKSFAILGISLKSPAQTSVGILDTESALLYPGEHLPVNLMYWTALPAGDMSSKIPVNITKPNKKLNVGEINFNINGKFGYGSGSIIISENNISPGPVRLLCKDIYSSLLGLMPTEKNSPRKNNYTMIAGGAESSAEFERMRKLGYDAVKIQIPWTNKEEPSRGQYNWSEWIKRMERIRTAGLNIEIRNPRRQGPDWLRRNASFMYEMRDEKTQQLEREYDPANTFFRNALINYYSEIGKLAKRFPEVISINANYGVRFRVGNKNSLLFGTDQLKSFRQYLEGKYKIAEINSQTNQKFKDFSEITAKSVMEDSSNCLLNEYVRHHQTLGATLQWDVAKAIRENSNAHLTFNHPYNSTEWTRTGTQLETYLRIGKELGPGSPFHETSDRYSLSFRKWLCAKTFSLEYGDEGFQNPPTYEHNALSYQWMAWIQCWDALYCQWWGGRPGNQNVAWIKPYSRMIYNAKYLSDPITLSLSFESDIHEARDVLSKGLHSTTGNHYGLVNTLLGCNLNAARYIFDKFPGQDKFASKLVIDDSSRYISDAFAQRIIEHIQKGGVFVTTPETDRLNDYAFFKRNGICVGKDGSFTGNNLSVLFKGENHIPEVKIKEIGKGKLVMLNKPYYADYDPTAPPYYLVFMRKLFASLGKFQPLVFSSKQGVYVCPYRTDNGNILLYVFNITAGEKKTQLKLRKNIIESPIVHDLRTGSNCSISSNGDYYSLEIKVPPLSSTVVKFKKK